MTGSWSECKACGCPVIDTATHAAFHESLALRFTSNPDTVTGPAWSGDPVPVVPPPTQAEKDEQALDRAALDALVAVVNSRPDGEPWVQPTGAHTSYRLGAVATHNGKTWRSLLPFNVWKPPTAWREEVPAGYPEWVQPTGSADAYTIGARVNFEGATYESVINANVWSPAAYPAGWKRI